MMDHDEKARKILAKRDEINKRSAIRKNKITRIAVIAAIVALTVVVSVVAVAASRSRKPLNNGADTTTPDVTTKYVYKDGVIGENTGAYNGGTEYPSGMARDYSYYSKSGDAKIDASYEEHAAEVSPSLAPEEAYVPGGNGVNPKAGTITAGEWKDLDNFGLWLEKLSQDEWKRMARNRGLDTARMIKVTVKDGGACFNVPVKLMSGDKTLFSARTDINGNAYLFFGEEDQPDGVSVNGTVTALDGAKELEINAENAGVAAKELDLMLMIDTTGSMGDELEYIKAELSDLVSRIAGADESFSIRISVNFYRDEGDLYVVKYFDFRSDVNECLELMKDEHADGGGDYPEAVHTALENAVTGHQWREDAVKLCFFVLDAPPHNESEIQGINKNILDSLRAAAENGVRIIPVASSGVDLDTEIVLRSFAVMTGGTYVFITNDSGIGGGHKEAEVGEHVVETLNECMIRIACEYCGIYKGEKIPYTQTYHQ